MVGFHLGQLSVNVGMELPTSECDSEHLLFYLCVSSARLADVSVLTHRLGTCHSAYGMLSCRPDCD